MDVRKTYAETKTGAGKRNHQDGNQGQKEYVTEHHEVVVADQEAIVAEFETQQIHIEAATAAQKDSEHYQLISAWGHLKLVDALELRANQYPSHASQNQNLLEAMIRIHDEAMEVELLA